MSVRRFLFLILCLAAGLPILLPGCDCNHHDEQKEDDKEFRQLQEQRQLLQDTLNHLTANKTKLTDEETAKARELWIEIRKLNDRITQLQTRHPVSLP